ncbi:MAG: hypothetical protein ACO3RU_13615 [Planctomycetota bacterium]
MIPRIGTYAFRRCECPGCAIDVYAPVRLGTPRCKAHGGPGYFEQVEDDEFGEPIRAAAVDPSPTAVRFPPLECE